MNPVAPETVPALLQALRDSVQWPNAYGRQYESSHHSSPLVRACAWLGEASAEQLGEMLRDEKAPVRRAAACVLALSGPTATGAKRNLQRASNSDEDNDVRLYAYAALERMDRGEGSLKNNAEFSSLLSGLNNRHEEFGFARLIQLAKVLDGTPFAEFPEGSISTGYETTEGLKRLIPELRKAGLGKMADAAERKLKR
jgi:hypothetical protein